MYTREEAKAIVDKVLNMAKADSVEVNLTGGERSGTRWANSSITTNLVQYDRNLSVTVYLGDKAGSASTRDFSDAGVKDLVDEARANANQATASPRPDLLGPQTYIPVDAALPAMVNFGPAERARMVKESIDICEKMGTAGAGYIPKTDQTTCTANSKGLFAYYRAAEAGLVLTCRMTTTPSYNVSARKNDVTRSRTHQGPPGTGGWEIALNSPLLADAERFADEAAEFCTATPIAAGLKDLILTPAHANSRPEPRA